MLHQNNLLTIARYSAIMNYVSSKFDQKCYLRMAFIGMINRNQYSFRNGTLHRCAKLSIFIIFIKV